MPLYLDYTPGDCASCEALSKDLEAARAEVAALKEQRDHLHQRNNETLERRREAEATAMRLRTALEFYADEHHWMTTGIRQSDSPGIYRMIKEKEAGATARAALAPAVEVSE